MAVRFLFVFDLLFNLFRIALWPSVGKELFPWLFTCAVCDKKLDYIGKVIVPSCVCMWGAGGGRGACVFPRVKFFHLFLQTESCNNFSQPESQGFLCVWGGGGMRGQEQKHFW